MVTINLEHPQCPNCNIEMILNPCKGGICVDGDYYRIPIVCNACGLELWIKALPVSVLCEEQFKGLICND